MNKSLNLPYFQAGKRHYLLCCDKKRLALLEPIKQIILEKAAQYEEVSIDGRGGKSSCPRKYLPLSISAKHHVFYAAGIGIISMMQELSENGQSFELHYAAKSREDCAFYSFLSETYNEKVSFYFSGEGNRLDTKSLLHHYIGTHIYICGPESFITSFTCHANPTGISCLKCSRGAVFSSTDNILCTICRGNQ